MKWQVNSVVLQAAQTGNSFKKQQPVLVSKFEPGPPGASQGQEKASSLERLLTTTPYDLYSGEKRSFTGPPSTTYQQSLARHPFRMTMDSGTDT